MQRQKKLGLRDWSEILGVAALVGFPEEVVHRATQRCANLFGEGMVMRWLVEGPFAEGEADTVVRYQPELLPDLDEDALEISSSSGDGSDSESESEGDINGRQRIIDSATRTTFCPIRGCLRKGKEFQDVLALKKHLMNMHKIGKGEVDDWVLPSDEEMEGAVHVDGWLRPLKRMAERGRYKKGKGKRKQAEEKSEDTASRSEEVDDEVRGNEGNESSDNSV